MEPPDIEWAAYAWETDYEIDIEWEDIPDATGYEVYRRRIAFANQTQENWPATPSASPTDSYLEDDLGGDAAGYEYEYKIKTLNGECASTFSATSAAWLPPKNPIDLDAVFVPYSPVLNRPANITVYWPHDGVPDGQYHLFRATAPFTSGGTVAVQVASIPTTSTVFSYISFEDVVTTPGMHYYYALLRKNQFSYSREGIGADVIAPPCLVTGLQWSDLSTGPWTDVSGTVYVPQGTTKFFKAKGADQYGTWPSGLPSWSGSSGITGTGNAQGVKSISFGSLSTTANDYKTVTATGQNNSQASVNVVVLKLTLDSVAFLGPKSFKIEKDEGGDYPSPDWQDNSTPPDGDADDPGDYKSPVGYTRGTTMSLSVYWKVEPSGLGGATFRAKGASSSSPQFPSTTAALSGGTMTCDLLSTHLLPNAVGFLDPLTISWQCSFDNGISWYTAGTSANPIYVTLADPQTKVHTLVHVSTVNSIGATTASQVLDGIWGAIQSKSIHRTSDTMVLTYYGFFDENGNGSYDAPDENRNDPNILGVTSAIGLIREGNGQCHSWAEFMKQLLMSQGVSSIDNGAVEVVAVYIKSNYGGIAFAVKDWATNGIAPWTPVSIDAGVDGSQAVNPNNGEAADAAGVEGQGNSPNPPSAFRNHFILGVIGGSNQKVYDPSYRLGPFSDHKDYENQAFEGYFDSGNLYPLPANATICDYN